MRFTRQQQDAITLNGNLLVAAAAGSGKTSVLTERIVRLVQEGADMRDFLVVTFTKAAASEMKKRIAARLGEEAENSPSDGRLIRASAEAASANISTLHAFCAQVLRRHFHEAGLDPAFRIADEAETVIIREDCLDAVIEQHAEANGKTLFELMSLVGGEKNFEELILKLYAFMQAQPDPLCWLERAVEAYGMSEEELETSDVVLAYVNACRRSLQFELEAFQRRRDEIAGEYPAVASTVDQELLSLRAALLHKSYASYAAALQTDPFTTLRWPRGTDEEVKGPLVSARNAAKDLYRAQAKAFSVPLSEEALRMQQLYPLMQALLQFVRDFDALYAAQKQQRRAVDYADLEHLALKLLSKARIAEEYRERFRYIFVDEYQDSNPLQERILACIRRTDNLFFVGDVKQSIYRFRLADPSIFLSKTRSESKEFTLVNLNANFRSTPAVIDTVNYVFSRIMSREVGELDYDQDAALVLGREDGQTGSTELHIIERRSDDEALVDLDTAELEALCAAQQIQAIMQNQRYKDPSTGKERDYRYSDFVILHRSPNNIAERLTQMLSLCGVPAYAQITGGLFDAAEVQVFLNLLRIIDNRRQDIPLLSILRSPIGGFSTEELILLRTRFLQRTCYDSLHLAAEGEDALGEKCRAFLSNLARWRKHAELISPSLLIGRLLDETGFADFAAALPGGALRRANLDALAQRASTYEATSARSLSDFIRFVDRLKNSSRVGAAQTAGANVVRVLSIHGSKGLEFPVVILAGLSKQFNRSDAQLSLLVDAEFGLGLRYTLDRRRYTTLFRLAIAEKKLLEGLAEEMRILYVGMTRAREKLVLLLSIKDVENYIKGRDMAVTPGLCERARRPSDWLVSALLDSAAGNGLRQYASLAPKLDDQPPLSVHVHTTLNAAQPHEMDQAAFKEALYTLAKADDSAVQPVLTWQYPFDVETRTPAKLTVSELTGNYPDMQAYPSFVPHEERAADRGTAAHALMQHITLVPHDYASVTRELERIVAQGDMTREQADAVYIRAVVAFFASPLGQRLCASSRVERELMFNHSVSAQALGVSNTQEPVLLQGVIDCCFLEDGDWVLVDYKTDFVPEGADPRTVASRHARQLSLYAEALYSLTGIPVKQKFVHLLRTGESVAL